MINNIIIIIDNIIIEGTISKIMENYLMDITSPMAP